VLHIAFCLALMLHQLLGLPPMAHNTWQAAVDNEDYDTAKLIKAEMDKLRAGLSYGSDHQALDRGMGGGGGGFGGGHRPANVVLEEEELGAAGAGGAGATPYVKNPFGNKSAFGGGAPAGPGPGGMHASPSIQYPPPAHNQAYSPQAQVLSLSLSLTHTLTHSLSLPGERLSGLVCVCVCVFAGAFARVCVCVCMLVPDCV